MTVNNSGNSGGGTVQMSNPAQHATVDLVMNFCRFRTTDCFEIVRFRMEGGQASGAFTFPRKGTFAGAFAVRTASGGAVASTGPNTFYTEQSFNVALVPARDVSGGIGDLTGNAPLSSGRATVQGQTVRVALSGTTPSSSFTVQYCAFSCFTQGTITTDAQGKASGEFTAQGMNQELGGLILVRDALTVQFISGFKVE